MVKLYLLSDEEREIIGAANFWVGLTVEHLQDEGLDVILDVAGIEAYQEDIFNQYGITFKKTKRKNTIYAFHVTDPETGNPKQVKLTIKCAEGKYLGHNYTGIDFTKDLAYYNESY